jgi:Domain of unknown function (DUF4123)
MVKPELASILAYLQAQTQPEQPLYAIVDAAQDSKAILQLLKHTAPKLNVANLFEGERGAELAPAAPHLIEFTHAGHPLLTRLVNQGWQNNWALYFKLRGNLPIKDKDGVGLFRFYDPRVFNLYIPSFDAQQLREFFGAISDFWIPDSNGNHDLIHYRTIGHTLNAQPVSFAEGLKPSPYLRHGQT